MIREKELPNKNLMKFCNFSITKRLSVNTFETSIYVALVIVFFNYVTREKHITYIMKILDNKNIFALHYTI